MNLHQGSLIPVNTNNGNVIAVSISRDSAPARDTDNLAAAGAARNDAFVGRAMQLNALAAIINDLTGKRAIAIVAGAGFGKTELAKEFVNTRARPASDGTDPSALAPDQWTGRWWLDGSKGGEAASLEEHYPAIVGEPFPDEPEATPNQNAGAAAAVWRTTIRRRIAQACSTGKQLLIIDNAESPDQIAEYRPTNLGRVIATTRRQPIPRAAAEEFPLDIMSEEDARELLAASREDLKDPRHIGALDAIARHLGHHALALAYASAALARPGHMAPESVLARMKEADIGDAADLLSEFDEEDLGGLYKMGLAQSLGLLVDELAEQWNRDYDPLAMRLAELAAFCDPTAIPVTLFVHATGEKQAAVEASLLALHKRSIITYRTDVSIHRLTQSLLRSRLKRRGTADVVLVLERLLAALTELCEWPDTIEEQRDDRECTRKRIAVIPHAESVIGFVVTFAASPLSGSLFPNATAPLSALPAAVARLQTEVARHFRTVGQLTSALRHIDAAINWGEAETPPDGTILGRRYALRARIRQNRRELDEAEADIQKSIDVEESQSEPDPRQLAIRYAARGSIRWNNRKPENAKEDIGRAIAWGEAQSPRDERVLGRWYALRASMHRKRDNLRPPMADIQKSIALEESRSAPSQRELAMRYAIRSGILRRFGDIRGAEDDINRCIAWGEGQSTQYGWDLANWYAKRAGIRRDLKNFIDAEADLTKCIEWGESQPQPNHSELAARYGARAAIRQNRGDLFGQEVDIESAIARSEAQSPRDERQLAYLLLLRADLRRLRGQLPGAEADITKYICWAEAQSPRNERDLAQRYNWRASLRRLRNHLPEAEEDTNKAIDLEEAQSPRSKQLLATLYAWRAGIRQDRRNLAIAENDITYAIGLTLALAKHDKLELSSHYASRSSIRSDRGDLYGAEADISKAIDVRRAHLPSMGAMLANLYASRASILRDLKQFKMAHADIDIALAWFQEKRHTSEEHLDELRQTKSSIDAAESR